MIQSNTSYLLTVLIVAENPQRRITSSANVQQKRFFQWAIKFHTGPGTIQKDETVERFVSLHYSFEWLLCSINDRHRRKRQNRMQSLDHQSLEHVFYL